MTTKKIDKLDFSKIKNLFIKGHYQENEKTTKSGENIWK